MAALTWRNVDVPHMDTRGMAFASDAISNSFDRMAKMLQEREATLRKEATDAQAVALLSAGDEAGLDSALQAALASGNKRVDPRVLADLANTQRNTILAREGLRHDNWISKDKIQDKEALNAFGEMVPKLTELYYGDKANERQALLDGLSGEEGFNRFLAQKYDSFQTAFQTGIDDRRQQQNDDRNYANERERIGISRAELDLRRQEKNAPKVAFQFGQSLAEQYAGMNPGDAALALQNNKQFLQMGPEEQQVALTGFKDRHKVLGDASSTMEYEGGENSFANLSRRLDGVATRATTQTAAAENVFASQNPALAIVRLAGQPEYAKATADDAKNTIDNMTGTLTPGFATQDMLRDGYTPAMIKAAGAVLGERSDFTSAQGYREVLEEARQLHLNGGATLADAELNKLKAPFEAAANKVESLKAAAERELRVNGSLSAATRANVAKAEEAVTVAQRRMEEELAKALGKDKPTTSENFVTSLRKSSL